jgi:ribosome-associated protein
MAHDVLVKEGIVIPDHEIEITASRSGGAGGQHVNKSNTKIVLRWNVRTTSALTDEQKARILEKLQSQLTEDGDLVIHSSEGRSQDQNKKAAFSRLANIVRSALHVPKKRMKTKISQAIKETRLKTKAHRSMIKKMRSKKWDE